MVDYRKTDALRSAPISGLVRIVGKEIIVSILGIKGYVEIIPEINTNTSEYLRDEVNRITNYCSDMMLIVDVCIGEVIQNRVNGFIDIDGLISKYSHIDLLLPCLNNGIEDSITIVSDRLIQMGDDLVYAISELIYKGEILDSSIDIMNEAIFMFKKSFFEDVNILLKIFIIDKLKEINII